MEKIQIEDIAAHLIPTVFGFADGCFQPGASVSEAATLSDAIGGIMGEQAGLATIQGQNTRRKEEWALQETLAGHDVEQIQAQIEGGKIKLEVAQKDLDMHQKSIQQAQMATPDVEISALRHALQMAEDKARAGLGVLMRQGRVQGRVGPGRGRAG